MIPHLNFMQVNEQDVDTYDDSIASCMEQAEPSSTSDMFFP